MSEAPIIEAAATKNIFRLKVMLLENFEDEILRIEVKKEERSVVVVICVVFSG